MPKKTEPTEYRCPDCRAILVNVPYDCPHCGFKGELEKLVR